MSKVHVKNEVLQAMVERLVRSADIAINQEEKKYRHEVVGILLESLAGNGLGQAIADIHNFFQKASMEKELSPRFVADVIYSFSLIYPDSKDKVFGILGFCSNFQAPYLFGEGITLGLLEILSMPDTAGDGSKIACVRQFFLEISSLESLLFKYLVTSKITRKGKGMLSNGVSDFFDTLSGSQFNPHHLIMSIRRAMVKWSEDREFLADLPADSVLAFLINQILNRFLLRLSLSDRLSLALQAT